MSRGPQQKLTFFKMHSLGNDFMVVDGVSRAFSTDARQISQWADRNRGIGFDQLLVIEPPTDPDADFYYRIFNADGSEAEQCGNGTRCVAMLVNTLRLTPKTELVWQSRAGVFETMRNGDQVSTSMTVPVLAAAEVPIQVCETEQLSSHQYRIQAGDEAFTFTPVSMGNPHAVIFVDNIYDLDVPALGARLTSHAAFPNQANIGFCQVADRHFMRLRVFERGTGETQACGSGACAAVVAAQLNDLVDHKVKVSLPGGKLRITWPGENERVLMSGPATLTYRGEISFHER